MKAIIVLPTYNEKENIKELINRILNLSEDFSILVVDDNSPDGTGRVVEKISRDNPRVNLIVRRGKRGFGPAYIDGFKKAVESDVGFVVHMDADLSHNPKDIKKLVSYLNEYDLVIGSRYIGGIRIINWSLWRLILSSFAGIYIRLITGLPIQDPTSGFCVWRKGALKKINFKKIKTTGYSFLIEMKHRAWKKKLKFKEIPIIFTDRCHGTTKMSKRIILEAVLTVIKLRFKKVK